jgi:DNA polymerase-3 subunit alpha
MGKKKPEEMAKQRDIFQRGAVERGVEAETAAHIFDLMEKFAGYGFNKSHSAAYALVSYQTLWLKAHHPAAFMAAVLSADMDNTDKVVPLIEECRAMRLQVEPPRANHSAFRFTVADERTVVYGLGAIKGVGESAIEGIVEAREKGGPFADLFDLCRRIDLKRVNRRVLESLIKAGALDELGVNRASLMTQLPIALRLAEQHHTSRAAGQTDLFGAGPAEAATLPDLGILPEPCADWEDEVRLGGEKETLGLYLTGHPIDRYAAELPHLNVTRIGDVGDEGDAGGYRRGPQRITVAGLVVSLSRRQTQKGPMASLSLDDRTGRIEVTLFNEAYEQYRDVVAADKVLVVDGSLVFDEFRGAHSLRADRVVELEQARAAHATHLLLRTDLASLRADGHTPQTFVASLAKVLVPFRGERCAVVLDHRRGDASGSILLAWRVEPRDELLRQLERLLGAGNVSVGFDGRRGATRHPAGAA